MALLWATSGPASVIAASNSALTAVQVSFWRSVSAAVVVSAFYLVLLPARRRRARREPVHAACLVAWRRPHNIGVCVANGVLTALLITLYIAAVDRIGIALATLVQLGTAPLVVVVVGRAFLGRAADRTTLVALALALAGLVLLVGSDIHGGGSLAGTLMAAASGVGLATVFLLSGSLTSRVPPMDVNAITTLVGTVTMLAVTLPGGLTAPAEARAIGAVIYLGIVASALAYGIYYVSAGHVRASTVAIVGLLEPLAATLIAAALFDEPIGPVQMLGGGALLLAVGVLNARASRSAGLSS